MALPDDCLMEDEMAGDTVCSQNDLGFSAALAETGMTKDLHGPHPLQQHRLPAL